MYSYHGWLSSSSEKSIEELKKDVPDFGCPIFIGHVNGQLQVNFSGNPNRDRGELQKTLNYLLEQGYMFHGIVYVNDANSDKNSEYKVIKVFRDSITETQDEQFSKKELNEIFL